MGFMDWIYPGVCRNEQVVIYRVCSKRWESQQRERKAQLRWAATTATLTKRHKGTHNVPEREIYKDGWVLRIWNVIEGLRMLHIRLD
jgi:hypothetical protein